MTNRRVTNCPNCGGPLPVSGLKCQFCGTRVVDLTMIDFEDRDPTMYVFRIPSRMVTQTGVGEGYFYISTWARPELLNLNNECETGEVTSIDPTGVKYFPIPTNRSISFDLTLKAYENPKTREIFKILYEE